MKEIPKHYEPPFKAQYVFPTGLAYVVDASGNSLAKVWDDNSIAQEIAAALNKAAKFDKIKKHRDILAMHLAEIKAIDDGESHNTIKATIDHCIAEVDELDPCGKNKAARLETLDELTAFSQEIGMYDSVEVEGE